MSTDGTFDRGTNPAGGSGGPNTVAFNDLYEIFSVGPMEPGPRRFTPPDGFPAPHQTSRSELSSTFWYDYWETPFLEDYGGLNAVVRRASMTLGNGQNAIAWTAYDASNMPAKYRFPNNRDRPYTTLNAPVDQPSDRVPFRREGGFSVSNWQDPPYLSGSFALAHPPGDTSKQNTTPFDVQRALKFIGTFAEKPDIAALPNPLGITAKMVEEGLGALPVIIYLLDSFKVPYVLKSGFRSTHKSRECLRFSRPLSFFGPHGGSPAVPVGYAGEYIVSVDDGHLISSQEHGDFNGVDIAGPSGTRAELDAILTVLRQYDRLFSKVMVGEHFLSWKSIHGQTEPDGTLSQSASGETPSLRAKNYHASTGRHDRGALIVSNGRRVERSPLYRSLEYKQIEPGPEDAFKKKARLDYPNMTQVWDGPGVDAGYSMSTPCCQSDRIHISATPDRLRDGLRDYLLAAQEAAGVVLNKPIRKPGNNPAKPNPGMTYPPILTTDLPINDFAASQNNQYSFGGTGNNFTLGVVRIPRGFREREFAEGLAVMFRLKYPSGAHETRDRFQFGFHRPAASVKGYSQGWTVLDAPDAGPTFVGVMGAQRRGEWIYGIAQQTFQGGQRRTQFVERMNSYKIRERRAHDDATYYEGLGGAASGATTDSFMPARNMDLFVSDHAEPELYYLSGFSAGKTTDRNGLPLAYRWVQEDQRGHAGGSTDPFYPSNRFKYEFWHTWQTFEGVGPANTQYPSLVFPWRSGDYSPPELWFFVPERSQSSTYTGRLKIYRSTYGPNKWDFAKGPINLISRWVADDPRLVRNGGTVEAEPGDIVSGRFSYVDDKATRNPNMSAYEGQWYQDKHLVGVIGPFRGAVWGDTRNTPNGSERVFRVVRDARRKDRLHLAMFQTNSAFPAAPDTPPTWDGVWFAQSQDDGRTWGRTRQMSPFVEDRPPHWQATYEGASPALAVTNGGDLIGLARATFKGEEQQALLNINYSGNGIITNYDRERVIFRTGSGGR